MMHLLSVLKISVLFLLSFFNFVGRTITYVSYQLNWKHLFGNFSLTTFVLVNFLITGTISYHICWCKFLTIVFSEYPATVFSVLESNNKVNLAQPRTFLKYITRRVPLLIFYIVELIYWIIMLGLSVITIASLNVPVRVSVCIILSVLKFLNEALRTIRIESIACPVGIH